MIAIGLGVLADVVGSAVLIWRFRAEQRNPLSGAGPGNATSLLALAALVLNDILGWWQAGRIAALVVAAIAAAEAWHTAGPWRSGRTGALRRG